MRKRYKAFTLAEVLITLAVIGVLVALTIPSLMQYQKKQEYVTGLKKFTAEFTKVLQSYAAANGTTDLSLLPVFADSSASRHNNLLQALKPHMSIIKDCGSGSKGCWNDAVVKGIGATSPTLQNIDNWTEAKAILADGMSLYFSVSTNCSLSFGDAPLDRMCGPVWVDINGKKKPNTYGRDVYAFYYSRSGVLYPLGSKLSADTAKYWDVNFHGMACDPITYPTGSGITCAARIMEEGWQMNY